MTSYSHYNHYYSSESENFRVKPPPPRLVDIRNYKNYDTALFKDDLQHVPWDIPKQDKAFETPDEVWNSFKDHFLTVADKHAPVVTRRV